MVDLPESLNAFYYPIKLGCDYCVVPAWKVIKRGFGVKRNQHRDLRTNQAQNIALWRNRANAWGRWSVRESSHSTKLNWELFRTAGIQSHHTVLDIAGGAGNPGHFVAQKLGREGRVITTDLVFDMLDEGRRTALNAGLGNVSYCVADMENLPFQEQSFDAAVSRFGLMFGRDHEEALISIRRLLKPGARAAYVVWGPIDKNPLFHLSCKTYASFFHEQYSEGDIAMFSLSEAGSLARLLTTSGYEEVEESEFLVERTFNEDEPFWVPILEQSFGFDFQQLAKDVQHAFSREIEKATESFRHGTSYHFTSTVYIGVGRA